MKIQLKDFEWLFNSFYLDFLFLKISKWPVSKKLEFLFIKYKLLAKHFFVEFEIGQSNVNFAGSKLYYDCRFGIAGYQRMLSTHQHLMQIAKMKNVKTIVDVGANVGFFSLTFRNLFPKAKIYSLEPIPSTFAALEKNVSQYKMMKAINKAASDKVGKVKMKFEKDSSSVSEISDKGNVTVETTTLDAFCKKENINKIDVLKLDVEGWEQHVLTGATKILPKVKYLYIEISMIEHHNYTISSVFSKLYGKGYDFQLVAFRNFGNTSEGEMPVMDALLINQLFK